MADGAAHIPLQTPFLLDDLKVGEADPRGRVVLDILWAVDEFKIYKTPRGVSPFFSDDAEIARTQKDAYLSLGEDIAHFNHLIQTLIPTRFGFARDESASGPTLTEYERELARCLAQALLGKVEAAKGALATLRRRLERRISNRARVIHLGINVLLVLAVWATAYAISISGYEPRFGFKPLDIALAAIMGSVGALFSTAVGLQKMSCDPTMSTSMHWIYGAQRVLVGVLGAIIVYFGFQSGVLNGIFQTGPVTGVTPAPTETNLYWLAFVSVLAGFSERLVPNLLDARSDETSSRADGRRR
ncbi:MAG: hypothetical protein AAGF90_16235 [Pseudomonadota bacterium]